MKQPPLDEGWKHKNHLWIMHLYGQAVYKLAHFIIPVPYFHLLCMALPHNGTRVNTFRSGVFNVKMCELGFFGFSLFFY